MKMSKFAERAKPKHGGWMRRKHGRSKSSDDANAAAQKIITSDLQLSSTAVLRR